MQIQLYFVWRRYCQIWKTHLLITDNSGKQYMWNHIMHKNVLHIIINLLTSRKRIFVFVFFKLCSASWYRHKSTELTSQLCWILSKAELYLVYTEFWESDLLPPSSDWL
jgi:hypothetical protein